MSRYKRIIFASQSGTCRAPMAMGMLREQELRYPAEILARGMVVLFPEPINPKAEAVLAGKGIRLEEYRSSRLTEEDFSEDTLVIVFSDELKKKILSSFSGAGHVYVLTELTGDELEIMDPYGRDLMAYGLCMESMVRPIRTLAQILNGERSADE